MQMRNKLLFYFAFFVLFTLLSFGLITFHLINEGASENDQLLLDKLIKIQSAYLKESTQRLQSIEKISEELNQLVKDENHLLLIIDKNAKVIHPATSQLQHQKKISDTTLDSLIKSSADNGYFKEFGTTYIWIKSKLEFGNLSVLYILEISNNSALYLNKLVKRLIVVAIVIFWVGVWGALITATILTRKINEQQNKIEYQANHDIMTGLQNRNFLATKIDQIIASRTVPSLSVILIGINRFKEINSTLGHDFGDILLLEFSKRLQAEFWSNDTIARFGSDQYALILPLSNNEHWKIVIEKIQKLLLVPFTIQDIHITSDVSIGVSNFPGDGNTASQLLRCAEVAMHAAKRSGRFYECYESNKDPNSIERLQLIGELSNAITNNELELHYQPKVSIDNMELIGCEALLRWNNPGRGRISPDIFIPLAEQGSMIKFLTEWVLDHAIKSCSDWHKSGKFISISVNLSARLLIEDSIVDSVSNYLQRHMLSPKYLILEITESAMMVDPVKARYILTQLAALGVSLSIDDFGTGYTSISQIQNMPVNEIKIDKSFVLNMLDNPGDANLVKLIIDMGHGMGHKITAEGIESQVVLDALKNLGCDIAQGYYLGRPLPLDEFIKLASSTMPNLH